MLKYDLKKVFKGHAASVYCLYLDDESPRIFSGSSDRMVGAWDLENWKADSFSVKLDSPVFSILKKAELLLIGQGSGGVHVIDLRTKTELRHLKYHDRPIFDISGHSKQPFLYFLGGDGVLSIVDSNDFSLSWSLPLSDDKLRTSILDKSEERLLIGSSDGFIRMLETSYYNVLSEKLAHEGGVYDMAWLTPEKLLTVGRDGHIRIWSFVNDRLVAIEAIPAHNFAIYCVEFCPSRKYFATASRDKTVKIWNCEDLKNPKRISRTGPVGHTHSVNTLKWINDNLLMSAGDDRDIYVWSISGS